MSDQVRVVLDAMGGDNAPGEIIKGCIDGLKAYKEVSVILVGQEELINKELALYTDYDKSRLEVVNATQVIDCNESPTAGIRTKKDSSIVVGMNLFKEGKADCFVSAGSTGAVFVGGTTIIKRIRGIERTPLAPVIPTIDGVSLLVDSGANVDAKPSHLVQYARMGSLYMEKVMGVKNPRVALLNIGVEEEKGNALVKETFPLLKACKDINFIGSVEARDVPYGACDVIVTDAFAGNVLVKMYEGTAAALMKVVKRGMMSTLKGKIGGLLVKKNLKKTLARFDATQYGGAPFLGLNGLVVKMHGSSKASEVKAAMGQCISFKKEKIADLIRENIATEKED